MLFRDIALIFSLEKPCYLENVLLENRVSGGVPVQHTCMIQQITWTEKLVNLNLGMQDSSSVG